jgi:small-conductance mechanosensitive channel
LFVAHEYVLGQLYQAIIDAAQYIESSKPSSTISYVTDEGENAFISVNGTDLKFRDLKVFPTNRPEDTQMFNEIRQLSQAVLQNGGTIYDVISLYSTKSMREMKKTFKDLQDRTIQQQQEASQQQQQQLDQQQKQSEATLEQNQALAEEKQENDNYQNELDRISKERIAIIQATGYGKEPSEDANQNGVPDVLEVDRLASEQTNATRAHIAKMAEITSKIKAANDKNAIEQEKIKVEREKMRNDLKISQINAKKKAKNK